MADAALVRSYLMALVIIHPLLPSSALFGQSERR